MAFRVRTLLEVLDGMLATVIANSEITDVNRGSVDRTLLEAAALQDADQYLQIARLKNIFSIETATGTDLDERGADFKIPRHAPAQAIGLVKFGDSNLTTKVETTLNGLHLSGVTSLALTNATAFPNTGSVVLDRDGGVLRELVAYTAKVGNNLTLATPTVNSHANLSSVILSTVGVDRVFASQSVVSVPATDSTDQLDFDTQDVVTLFDGDVVSSEVAVVSQLPGSVLNVGTGQISIVGAPPFQTATVTNDTATQGGRDVETDADYRQRIKQTIAALSNGTITDLLVAASNVSLLTGQRVITAQVVEEFTDPDVSVYIDDGTGTVGTSQASQTSLELLIHKAETGQRRAHLINWPVVTASSLSLKKSAFQGGTGSPTQINAVTPGVGTALLTITGAAFTPAALVGLTLVDDNRNNYVISANTANDATVTVPPGYPNPVPGSYAIFPATFLGLTTDYLFNETTGDIELVTGLTLNSSLAAVPNPTNAYTYYTGLIQEVQRVLNGDPADLTTYPGVKADGVKLKVRAPNVQTISFSITVISAFGTIEADLVSQVQDVVQRYVNSLGVGDDVILAEIIAAVMSVPGITDVSVNSPPSNVVVLDGTLPRTKASLITVL